MVSCLNILLRTFMTIEITTKFFNVISAEVKSSSKIFNRMESKRVKTFYSNFNIYKIES